MSYDDHFDRACFYLDAMTEAEETLRTYWAEIHTENMNEISPDGQKRIWSLEFKMKDQEILRSHWFGRVVDVGFTPRISCEWHESKNMLVQY